MNFKDLNLAPNILRAVEAEGYETPSDIQSAAIPPLLLGRDLIGCAQTGTGKTAAFALPILHLLQERGVTPERKIRVLVLTPTRELALQIFESFHAYGRFTKLKYGVIFGGVSQRPQETMLKRGIDVLVATPGRLNDLIGQGLIHLSGVEIFVLDEADRMLDMGFINDVKKVIRQLPEKKQTLLFSATMPEEIRQIAQSMMADPERIAVKPVSSTVDTVTQAIYFVDKGNKQNLLIDLLREKKPASTLVFTRTKHGADKVARHLTESGIRAAAIHGNKSQNNRQEALKNFKAGSIKVLVATDIAARGIDVDKLSLVINFDLPNIPETYVHRIGRTGRAGNEGESVSFCDHSEKPYLKDIEKLININIPVIHGHAFPLIDTSDTVPPESAQGRRNQQRRDGIRTDSSRHTGEGRQQSRHKPPHKELSAKQSAKQTQHPASQEGQNGKRRRSHRSGGKQQEISIQQNPSRQSHSERQVKQEKPLRHARQENTERREKPARQERPAQRDIPVTREAPASKAFVSRSGPSFGAKPQDAPITTGARLNTRK